MTNERLSRTRDAVQKYTYDIGYHRYWPSGRRAALAARTGRFRSGPARDHPANASLDHTQGLAGAGHRDFASAALEAREEAGVLGHTVATSIGTFMYEKRRASGAVLVEVTVFPLEVREELEQWPEGKRRQRAWFTLLDAAALVQEPGLQELLLRLDQSTDLRSQ
jgi:hypothetical protein